MLTPEEQQEYAQLLRKRRATSAEPPQQQEMGGFTRLLANTANSLWQTPLSIGSGLGSRITGMFGDEHLADLARESVNEGAAEAGFQIPEAQTTTQKAADVGGQFLGAIPTYMTGARLFGGAARGIGMSEKAARLVGTPAFTGLAGYAQGGATEGAIGAGQGLAMEAAGALLPKGVAPAYRALVGGMAGAGSTVAAQAARGQDVTSTQSLTETAIMGALPFALEGRRLFRGAPKPEAAPAPPVRAKLPEGWQYLDSTETEHGFINRFRTPEGVVERRSAMRYEPGPEANAAPPSNESRPFVEVPAAAPAPMVETPAAPAEPRLTGRVTKSEAQADMQRLGRELMTPVESMPSIESNAPQHLLRPIPGGRQLGAVNPQLLHAITGATATAGAYAASDDENKLRNAALTAGAFFGAPRLLRGIRAGIGTPKEAQAQMYGDKTTQGGTRRFLEKNFKLGRDAKLDAILDTSQGSTTRLLNEYTGTLESVAPKIRTLDPASKAALDEYLQSDRSPVEETLLRGSGIDPQIAEAAIRSSQIKGELQKLIAHGERDPQKIALINDTLGTYQTNQFRAFLDPENWKADPALKDQIVREQLFQRLGGGRIASNARIARDVAKAGGVPQLARLVRRDVDEWVKEASNPRTQGDPMRVQGEGASRISRALFMKRKQLTPATQKFLGQIDDPFEREVLTVTKLAKSAPTAKFIGDVMRQTDSGGNRYALTEKEWLDAGSPEGYVQSKTTPGLGGLATGGKEAKPMMVQRQVADVLRMDEAHATSDFARGVGDMIVRLNRIPKGAATVWNPGTHIRNMLQFPLMAAIGGVSPLKIPKYLSRLKTDPALLRAAQDSNMFGANFGAGEFRRTANYAEHILEPWSKKPIRRSVQAIQGALKTAYGWSDNLARGAAFVKYWDEAAAKGMTGDARRLWATEQVNRYLPNYSNVSNAVEVGRNVPFVNPFITYTAEMTRIAKNLAQDVVTNKEGRRLRSGIALLGMFTLGTVIKSFAQNAFLTEGQRKEFAEIEKMMPDYMRQRINVPLSFDEKHEDFHRLDLTPFLPTGDFEMVAKAILSGDVDALIHNNPVIGVNRSPSLNMASEMISGRDSFTGQPIPGIEESGFNRVAIPAYKAMAPSLAPGNYMANRLVAGFSRNQSGELGLEDRNGKRETPGTAIAAVLGANTSHTGRRMLTQRAESNRRRLLAEARDDLNAVMRTNVSQAAKDRAAINYERKRQRILSSN